MSIAIVKYGMGNVHSVQKVLKKLGYESIITADHKELKNADVILLPGVGSFKKAMENLSELKLVDLLTTEVVHNKKPFIGICLGMQLIASFGDEPERTKGLDWVKGEVVRITSPNGYRIPHLGWNSVSCKINDSTYKNSDGEDFYFIHSYHFKPANPEQITLTVDYDGEIVAGIQKDNIHAVQFHPEKSQEVGLNLLEKILLGFVKK